MSKISIRILIQVLILVFDLFASSRGQLIESVRLRQKPTSALERKVEAAGGSDPGSSPFSKKESSSGETKRKSSNFQTSLVEIDNDYDFNVPPPTDNGDPVQVFFSINLRNIIQVTVWELLLLLTKIKAGLRCGCL